MFRNEEMDGQALMLMTTDHLGKTMGMKLGPALKLHSKIQALKDAASNS